MRLIKAILRLDGATAFAALAALCVCGASATDYAYVDPVFYVTNPSGSPTNDLTECTFTKSVGGAVTESSWSEFAAATAGTLVKQGTGWVTVASNLGAFTGEIHVEAGVWDVCHTNGIGSYLGGAAFAHDGATIVMERKPEYMSWKPPYDKEINNGPGNTKAIVMEGEGAEGMGGALVAKGSTVVDDFFAPARYPTLTNDATVIIDQTGMILNWRPAGIWKLNGNTLTVKGAEGWVRPTFKHNNTAVQAGNIICENVEHYFVSGASLAGGPGFTNTLDRQSSITFQNVYSTEDGDRNWTLDYRDVSYFRLTAGTYDGYAYEPTAANRKYMAWYGPILLGCDMRLYNTSSLDTAANPHYHHVGLNLHGRISGDYGIKPYPDALRYMSDITLGLHCPTNTFTGGVTLGERDTLVLWANGALPADGGAAVITNGSVMLMGDGAYSLPALEIHGTGTVYQASIAGGSWSSVLKTGDGTLVYDASTGAATIDMQGGTLRMVAASHKHWEAYAGLSEWTNKTAYKTAMTSGEYLQSSITSLCVRVAESQYGGPWCTDHSSNGADFGVAYRGFIWNDAPTNEVWTFVSVMDKAGKILIDDEVVVDQTVRNEAKTANMVISPGPHKFEFRYYNTSGNSGATTVTVDSGKVFKYIDDVLFDYAKGKSPCYAVTDNGDGTVTTNGCWVNKFGFGIDRLGRRSYFYTDYKQPKDPGDGSVFTTVTNVELVLKAPVFGTMKFAAGTTLDLCGAPLPYEAVGIDGLPAVTNGDLKVTGTWTASANDVAGGGALRSSGALVFGDAAAIAVTVGGHQRNSPEGGWVLAEAEGGISLPADWQSRVSVPSGKYALSLSADGKRLMLSLNNGFIFTIR